MKSNLGIFLISLIFTTPLQGHAGACYNLEGINLGNCVPSSDHPCLKNKNPEYEGSLAVKCKYYKSDPVNADQVDPALIDFSIYAQTGPIAWQCQTWNTPTGICTTGGDSTTCPSATCKIWSQPLCVESCELCIKEEKNLEAPAPGCILCNRKACDDEEHVSPPRATCPADPGVAGYILPERTLPLCAGKLRCPATAQNIVWEDGKERWAEYTVNIRHLDCPEKSPIKKKFPIVKPPSCPWKVDERSSSTTANPAGGCEPIRCDNCFTSDCKASCK